MGSWGKAAGTWQQETGAAAANDWRTARSILNPPAFITSK
jgi:hypothetical protein